MATCAPGAAVGCVGDHHRGHTVPDVPEAGGPVPAKEACSLVSARIGHLRGLFEDRAETEMLNVIRNVLERTTAAGAFVSEPSLPDSFDEAITCHRRIMRADAAKLHKERLAEHPDDYLPR